MPSVALLTLDDRGDYVIDDAIAIDELRRRGWAVEEIPWRRGGVAWGAFDLVVVRTTWDYQHHLEEFLAALEAVEAAGVPLANPSALVRWNARKTYLRDLESRGVRVVPTLWGHGLSPDGLRALAQGYGAGGFVLKPTVSANAFDTYRVAGDVGAERAAEIAGRFDDRDWMAQAFVRSVLDEGEFSVFYFDGEYSHAIVKRPAAGDFRVQEEHGGFIAGVEPDAALRAAADRVLAALDEAPLQARVDLVRLDDGALALMELEAIEPSLYFRMHPDAAANFADGLTRYLARVGGG